MTKTTTLALYGGVALGLAALDQWIKRLVVETMELYERIDVMPFLSWFHTRNTGIAFSFLSGFDDTAMVALTFAVMLFIGFLAVRTAGSQHLARLGFAFILGGALGNIIDRAMHGYVVDYVLLHAGSWSFAVFNLADAAISVGAVLVILQEFLDWRGWPTRRDPPPAG
ncbi:MAG: signal peptidase II [Mesorhizobium sp.]|nr:signal peptidase II [Mesorhizobium sp.]